MDISEVINKEENEWEIEDNIFTSLEEKKTQNDKTKEERRYVKKIINQRKIDNILSALEGAGFNLPEIHNKEVTK